MYLQPEAKTTERKKNLLSDNFGLLNSQSSDKRFLVALLCTGPNSLVCWLSVTVAKLLL